MDTAKTDRIPVGTIITVVSARHNSNGQLRVEYGPLEIAWSKYDGGWVSVQTAAGDIAWEVHQDIGSESEDNEEQLKEQEQTEVVEATDVQVDGCSEPAHGFEVDSMTSRPILTSNRNKMDPSFGAPFSQAKVNCFGLDVSCYSSSSVEILNSRCGAMCAGVDKDELTGFIGSGIVEQIEQTSPIWPQRILMGVDDPMLDCSLHDFVLMMRVRDQCTSNPTG